MNLKYVILIKPFIYVMMVASIAQANPRGPLFEKSPNPSLCEYTNELSGEVQLDPNCYYEQQFEITEPDTTLDCRGAELRGSGKHLINIKRGADRAKVMNCYLDGGKGLVVRVRQPRNDETVDDVRALGASEVVIQNIQVSNSEGVGVHLLVYTSGVTVKDSIIINNSSAGIYMSPYGQRHLIQNNLISSNGHVKPDGVARLAWYRREGIAVDAASENIIVDNEIANNAFGGILLYKNCWEHAEAEPDSRPRTEHARANLIQGNRFSSQPFGVWVAARQSRDLEEMECGDPTPYDNPINITELLPSVYWDYPSSYVESYLFSLNSVHIWPDFAEENVITENRFEDISLGGVRVEDDDTEVTQNLFVGDFDYIFLGAPFRARLADQPVQNTLIQSNSFLSDEDILFIDHLALMPNEHASTVLEDNHRACLLDDGQILFHGEVTFGTQIENEACPETEYRCDEGSFIEIGDGCEMNNIPNEADQSTETYSDYGVSDMNVNENQPVDADTNQVQIQTTADSSSQKSQGCVSFTNSPSLPIFSLIYLLAWCFRNRISV